MTARMRTFMTSVTNTSWKNMPMLKILIDTDVALNVLLKEEPFFDTSSEVLFDLIKTNAVVLLQQRR